MHREDIKAAIRKRFGTLAAFERANDLPAKSVTDMLRGRKSGRVEQAINNLVRIGTAERGQTGDNYNPIPRIGKQA